MRTVTINPPASAGPAAPSVAAVGIGITTRDRWDDLANTLSRVRSYPGLEGCPIVVVDDGSAQPCPAGLRERFPDVRFRRDDVPRGLIAQRNRLIREELDADYFLSLDDDAFPVAGEVAGAVAFLRGRPDALGLAFNLIATPEAPAPLPMNAGPFPVRLYIGCGHLLDRRKFLALGGYREEFFFYNEEWDLAARGAGRGWSVLCHPGLVICHQRSAANRAGAGRAFAYARSKVLFALWTLPLATLPAALPMAFLGTLRTMGPAGGFAALRGVGRGLIDGLAGLFLRGRRQPLSLRAYRAWRQLPWPPFA